MLFRKMLRDIISYRVQFISIFLMSFIAIIVYSGLGSETKGYEDERKRYYEDNNLADIWLYGSNFTEEDKKAVEEFSEVKEVSRRLSIETIAKLQGNPVVNLYFLEDNKISTAHIVEGEEFDITSEDGIWLDSNFASKRELKVGEIIELTYMGVDFKKEIKGIIMSPEYVYKESAQMIPDHYKIGFAYLSEKAFSKSFASEEGVPFTQMIITLKEPCDLGKLEDKLYEALPANEETKSGGLSVFLDRSNLVSDKVFMNEITERKAMTAVFPIAFLSISLLTILTTMTRIVSKQRTQIGTLKALGFSKKKITRHYVAYGFFLTLLGGGIGAVAGPLVLPPLMFDTMKRVYTLPNWKGIFLPSTLYVLGITVGIATLITYISCGKILGEKPASTLRPLAPKTAKMTWLEKTKFWSKRSFSIQWNLRDVMRSKGRSAMAIVGVIGCMGLLITGFGCLDAFSGIVSIKYDKIEKYENCYNLDEMVTPEQTAEIKEIVEGQGIMENAIELKSESKKRTTILFVNDAITLRQYLDKDWKTMDLPKEGIALSSKLSKSLGVEIGDTIKWHLYGDSKFFESKITMIYRDPTEQGATLSRNEFEKLGFDFKETLLLSNKEKINDLEGVANITNRQENRDNIMSMLKSMNVLIAIICVAALLLAVVVLYNLGVLSFSEKERELATLKVLGFQSAKIRKILLIQNLWLSIVGIIPGYFVGKLILIKIMSSMGEEFDLRLQVSSKSILISVILIMIVSVLVNYLFSGKVNKLDMVSSLKGVE